MNHQSVIIRSPDGRTSATLHPSYGGLVSSLIMPWQGESREWLYRRPQFWETVLDGGGLPFLFPVCGRHRLGDRAGAYQWNGVEYVMPLHGFSLHHPWELDSVDTAQASISLAASDSTRSCYPFDFRVKLSFAVENGVFRCRQTYINMGTDPMPFFAGFHPYFQIPDPGDENVYVDGSIEAAGTYNGTYTDIIEWKKASASMNALEAARGNRAFRLTDTSPASLRIQQKRLLIMTLSGQTGDLPFRYLQFYRTGNDPFVCVEPWMGLPNSLNHPETITVLAPGESKGALFEVQAG